jgi:hypothetical protein
MHDAWMHAHARMGAHTYTYTWGHVSDLVLHMYTYTNYSPPFPCLTVVGRERGAGTSSTQIVVRARD